MSTSRRGSATRGTIVAATALLALIGSATANATQSGSSQPDLQAEAVARMVTAAEVATWGRANGDAHALLVAARMIEDVRPQAQDGEAPFLTTTNLLAEAEAMSPDDPAVRGAILVMRTQTKGVRASAFGPGPIVIVRRVRARETFGFEVEARPNEVLRVAAIGDGDTNIDLVLRDAAGTVLCSDSSMDHYPVCTLARPRGGPVRVEVVNRGSVWSRVQILTN
jgi:hypothetical protein